jgi:hypothetical protein
LEAGHAKYLTEGVQQRSEPRVSHSYREVRTFAAITPTFRLLRPGDGLAALRRLQFKGEMTYRPGTYPDIHMYPGDAPISFRAFLRREGEVLDVTNSDITAPVTDNGVEVAQLTVSVARLPP